MANTFTTLVESTALVAAATSQYEAVAVTARIDAACVVNTDTVTRQLSVYIIPSGGSASSSNILIDARGIAPGESYTCPELINQAIKPGRELVTACSGTGLTMTVSGTEISA